MNILSRLKQWISQKILALSHPLVPSGRKIVTWSRNCAYFIEPHLTWRFGFIPVVHLRERGGFSLKRNVFVPLEALRTVTRANLEAATQKTADRFMLLAGVELTELEHSLPEFSGDEVLKNSTQQIQVAYATAVMKSLRQDLQCKFHKVLLDGLTRCEHVWKPKPVEVVLPPGTRFVETRRFKEGSFDLYVVEEFPQMRKIRGPCEEHLIALPFVVFVVALKNGQFYSLHVFFRTEGLRSKQDMLYKNPFPHIIDATTMKMCLPFSASASVHPHRVVEMAIQYFWGSQFTVDPQGGTWYTWEKNSRENRGFVLNHPWEKLGTLEELLARLIGGAQMRPILNDLADTLTKQALDDLVEVTFQSVNALDLEAVGVSTLREFMKAKFQEAWQPIVRAYSPMYNAARKSEWQELQREHLAEVQSILRDAEKKLAEIINTLRALERKSP